MVLRLMPRSPRRRIPFASVIGELTVLRARSGSQRLRRFDASHGRQDHTVLPYASVPLVCRAADRSRAKARPAIPQRSGRCRVHRIPCPTSVTIAIRPSWRAGNGRVVGLIWVEREEVYFRGEDWTGQIILIGLGKLDRTKTALRDPSAGFCWSPAVRRMGGAKRNPSPLSNGYRFAPPILRTHHPSRCWDDV
jgi:hypothetical protein